MDRSKDEKIVTEEAKGLMETRRDASKKRFHVRFVFMEEWAEQNITRTIKKAG
jgi:hypothetical protein